MSRRLINSSFLVFNKDFLSFYKKKILHHLILWCNHYSWTSRFDSDVYEKSFVPHIRDRGNPVPSMETLAYNGSLVLSNYHPSISIPVRVPQNYIKIGGFHIDQVIKPLPQVKFIYLFILLYIKLARQCHFLQVINYQTELDCQLNYRRQKKSFKNQTSTWVKLTFFSGQ